MREVKLIVADLDGTLLHTDKTLDHHIKEILCKKKIPLTFISGRNVHIIQEYLNELEITYPYITNNGANMFLGNKCIYECAIESHELKQCLDLLYQKHVAFLAYTNEKIFSSGEQPGLRAFIDRLIGKCEIIYDAKFKDYAHESIFKVVMIHPEMEEIKDKINYICHHTVCMQSEGEIYTLTNKAATKGKTLEKLLEVLNLKSEEVVAFGDNYNDLSMFDVVDGIAVMNAQDPLKKISKYLTKSNDEDGVSYFIEHHLSKLD